MQIVARWLRERTPDEGRLIYLTAADLEIRAIGMEAENAAAGTGALPQPAPN